ncbi:HAAS domain-containing protein [Halobacillus naozhouensis]|uniref:HAAS transmembrane region domain-containing protein n=1 Tax=Halobacillus naozhouensis TaxID=554880 RepID=A0ABY8J0Z8_9BACI|nr:hypothetical protein [Halobacillus naozhouensis]WFT76015.1 hypothetical protein P9989_06535 [Halobacillus naozhouensis]
MILSNQSREFLENLRLYLVSSGKKEEDIEDIVSELGDHLSEAEKQGKSVHDIVGQSPREYMEQLGGEMRVDSKSIVKYGTFFLMGALAYILLGDVIRGGIELSVMQLVGYPVIFFLYIGLIAGVFRHIASSQPSKRKQWTLLGILGVVPISLFLGLIILNEKYETPAIQFSDSANLLTAISSVVIFIGMSVWSKTWVSILVPLFIFGPELLLNITDFQESTKITLSSLLMFAGLGSYFFYVYKKESRLRKRTNTFA